MDSVPVTTFSRRRKRDREEVKLSIARDSSFKVAAVQSSKDTAQKKACACKDGAVPGSKKVKKMTQMFLDMGQKNFFSKTCSACGFVYTPGKKDEEQLHNSHHNEALSLKVLKFKGNPPGSQLLLNDSNLGKIYRSDCFKNKSGNVRTVMGDLSELLEREMGICHGWIQDVDTILYMYLNDRKELVGCIILESSPVTAYKASSTVTTAGTEPGEFYSGIVVGDKNSPSKKKCQCAVRLMWTSRASRRKHIATKLLDCARAQLVSGQIIPRENIAFSQPSHDGALFIQKFVQSSEFYVYEQM